jgi:tetratricopeptide (TPR) repeat protein
MDAGREAERAYRKARALLEHGSKREALRAAHRAMGLQRDNAEYVALCGYLIFLSDGWSSFAAEESLRVLDRALTLDEGCVVAQFYKGLVLEQSGRSREAIAAFERTLDLDPDHLEAARHLRDAHRGDRDAPQGWLGRLLSRLRG